MEPVFHPLTWLWALPAWKEIIVKRQRRHTFINTSSSLYNQLPLYLLIIPFPPRGRAPHFYPMHWLLYQTGLYKFKFKSKSDNTKKKLSYLLTHLFSPLIILAQRAKYVFVLIVPQSSSCMTKCNRPYPAGFLVHGGWKFRGESKLKE